MSFYLAKISTDEMAAIEEFAAERVSRADEAEFMFWESVGNNLEAEIARRHHNRQPNCVPVGPRQAVLSPEKWTGRELAAALSACSTLATAPVGGRFTPMMIEFFRCALRAVAIESARRLRRHSHEHLPEHTMGDQ